MTGRSITKTAKHSYLSAYNGHKFRRDLRINPDFEQGTEITDRKKAKQIKQIQKTTGR